MVNENEAFVQRFLSGEIGCEPFLQEYQRQAGLRQCLDDFYNEAVTRGAWERLNPPLDMPEKYMDWIGRCANVFFRRAQLYDFVYRLFVGAGREQAKYSKYEEEHRFSLDAVPEYAAGDSAVRYLEAVIFPSLPQELPASKRAALCRKKIKEAFHIEGRHYPRWVQEAEWPFRDGKPMRFVGQKTEGERVTYTFADDETGEVETIEQYY